MENSVSVFWSELFEKKYRANQPIYVSEIGPILVT